MPLDATSFQGNNCDRFGGDKTGNWKKIDGVQESGKKTLIKGGLSGNNNTIQGLASFRAIGGLLSIYFYAQFNGFNTSVSLPSCASIQKDCVSLNETAYKIIQVIPLKYVLSVSVIAPTKNC